MLRALLTVLSLALGACSLPQVLDDLEEHGPPPELGRPGYVRFVAKTGAVTGGVVGAVASVVLLPITWPISLVADRPLGVSSQEFLFMPVTWGASSGHFLLGAPADGIDFVVRRAWVDEQPPAGYETTPPKPPVGPGPAEPQTPAGKPAVGSTQGD